ncbi:MAG: hypothetical protein GWP07_08015 [Xanthomonadaceae bacterium]|nr:hypothetical protein [Xanthomonadaceae bacterium]
MALAHSRCTSCAAPRCPPRITVVVIRSAFGGQCRYDPCRNILKLVAGTTWRQVGFSCFI